MESQGSTSGSADRRGSGNAVLAISIALAAVLLLSLIPTAWATGDAAPLNQTVPTPAPAPTGEGGKPKPDKVPAVPAAPGQVDLPVTVPLGPGDGVYVMARPNAGCIQVNTSGLPTQMLFELTPLSPDTLPAPLPGCTRTSVAYGLKVWNTATGQEVQSVMPAYLHTICYTDADLVAAGGDPNRFVIARYNEAGQTWETLDPTLIDTANRHAVGSTTETGRWSLFACVAEAPPMVLPETGQVMPPAGAPLPAVAGVTLGLLILGTGVWRLHRARGN